MNSNYYKVVVYIPEQYLEILKTGINKTMTPIHRNYDYVFSWTKVRGSWRPLEGAKPYKGKINELEEAEEIQLSFTVASNDLTRTLEKIKKVHPYEEPVIDVFPVFPYFEILKS